MKRLFIVSAVFILSIPCLSAQYRSRIFVNEEGKIYFIPIFKQYQNYTLKIPDITSFEYSYISTPVYKLDMWKPSEVKEEISFQTAERAMDVQVLSGAYKPFFYTYAPLLRTYPMAFNFFETYVYSWNDNSSFIVSGLENRWPGGGSINTISTALSWRNDNWEIWSGGFAGRYSTPYDLSPGFMGCVNGGVNYQATEWMKLRAWGEYTLYDNKGKSNMFLYLNNQHKQTSVVGAMEFKVNENFGLGVGIQHNFNPVRNKWERQEFIYPVLNNKRFGISIGN